jgi:hypothetical protein
MAGAQVEIDDFEIGRVLHEKEAFHAACREFPRLVQFDFLHCLTSVILIICQDSRLCEVDP